MTLIREVEPETAKDQFFRQTEAALLKRLADLEKMVVYGFYENEWPSYHHAPDINELCEWVGAPELNSLIERLKKATLQVTAIRESTKDNEELHRRLYLLRTLNPTVVTEDVAAEAAWAADRIAYLQSELSGAYAANQELVANLEYARNTKNKSIGEILK